MHAPTGSRRRTRAASADGRAGSDDERPHGLDSSTARQLEGNSTTRLRLHTTPHRQREECAILIQHARMFVRLSQQPPTARCLLLARRLSPALAHGPLRTARCPLPAASSTPHLRRGSVIVSGHDANLRLPLPSLTAPPQMSRPSLSSWQALSTPSCAPANSCRPT